MPKYSVRGRVIERWEKKGCPKWDYKTTKKRCLEEDHKLAEEGQNPAPQFRKEVGIKNESYIKRWVLGCHFPWLNPRKSKRNKKQDKTRAIDHKIKKIGDEILSHINFIMDVFSGDDANLRFKLNRWVYSRLLQAEIKAKRPIKKKLWESGMNTCQAPGCNKIFKSLKNVEIHRKNQQKIYSIKNCILVCRECHEKLGKNV